MDATTPTTDVVNSRPLIINLAKVVFRHTTMATARAFSQFKSNAQLAKIIDAKRDGKFDFGVLIKETDTGADWPKANIVLKALNEVEKDGELSDEIVEALGLADENELSALLMQKTKKKKPAAKKRAPAKKKPAAKKAAPKKKPTAKKDPEPKEEGASSLGSGYESAPPLEGITELIDGFRTDLGKSLQDTLDYVDEKANALGKSVSEDVAGIHERMDVLEQKTDAALSTMSLIGQMVEALNGNLQTVGQYIDPYIELPLQLEPEDDEEKEDLQPEEDPEPEEEEASPDGGEIVTVYSDEDLQAMELPNLIKVAESLGIANAHKISFRGVAIRKIQKAQV